MAASGLRTDLYELTMMNGYLSAGLADRWATFDLFIRSIPEGGGYCVAAGLADAVRFVREARFGDVEINYLRTLGLFPEAFLDRLRSFRFRGHVDAVPEGTLVFPLAPILRVQGPFFEAQLLESALLNLVNFQTRIATKTARVVLEAGAGEVIEFGMRRAHGIDGALSAARAAFIGGAAGTSNAEAGCVLGIPVSGTQAHSWVMAFDDELAAFRAYAAAYPDGAVLLVDTYDTLRSGVPHAIQVGRELAAAGHRLRGIRLDSGDLAYLSIRAREMLDAAGLGDARIAASGDLDEWIIHDLQAQGARIDLWGVGTRMVTGQPEPALTGVYKLAAVREDGRWVARLKVSERGVKATLPGVKQVWRLVGPEGCFEGDLIAQADETIRTGDPTLIGYHPLIEHETKRYAGIREAWPLLEPVMRDGAMVGELPNLVAARERARAQLRQLHPTSRRLLNPHIYKVSVSAETLRRRGELRDRLADRIAG